MFKEKGIYVFPSEKNIWRYLYNGNALSVLPVTSYTAQLIDFLEYDFSFINNILKEIDSYKNRDIDQEKALEMINDIKRCIAAFRITKPVYGFLLYVNLYTAGVYSNKPFNRSKFIKIKNICSKILFDVLRTQSMLFVFIESYCRQKGSHEEKFNHSCSNIGYNVKLSFEQVVASNPVNLFGFRAYDLTAPFSFGYRLESLAEYMWFIFINAMKEDNHISQCQYCGHFFVPKTKRKTLYCDRVITDSGLTCKQVGPVYMHRALAKSDTIMREYQRAINRNYKRWERYNMHSGDRKKGKDISYDEYCEWIKRLLDSKQKFYSGDITKEKFLSVIKELDK